MGAFLDKPKTDKVNDVGQGAGLTYGVASMQGWRIDMEDAHVARIGLGPPQLADWAFFAVFDGHAGNKVAHYSSQHLLPFILQTKEFTEVLEILGSGTSGDSPQVLELISKGLRAGFLGLDEKMRHIPELYGDTEQSGSTAISVLVSPTHLFFANLGDSRAVHSREGTVHFATEDHKPFLAKERQRIVNAGGSVMIQRVNGSLAVSRALGDYEYKNVSGCGPTEQLVSPEPDVCVVQRNPQDEFVLVACDGVYDVMSNQDVSDFLRSQMRIAESLSEIGNQLLDACLSKGSRDNMSAILIKFPGAPTVVQSAVTADAELRQELERRIRDLALSCDGPEDLDIDYVLRVLIDQDVSNVPPGAGLHAMRGTMEQIIEKLRSDPKVFSGAGTGVASSVMSTAPSKQPPAPPPPASLASTATKAAPMIKTAGLVTKQVSADNA